MLKAASSIRMTMKDVDKQVPAQQANEGEGSRTAARAYNRQNAAAMNRIGATAGGRWRFRTSDPLGVNEVLYR